MLKRPIKTNFLLLLGLAGVFAASVTLAQDLQNITTGERALTFASGYIRHTMPLDGTVNLITGDNQTTGNRMVIGAQDVLYLRLANPAEVNIGDLYTVYRRVHKVFHPIDGQYMGYLINMLGVVRVTQVDHGLTSVKVIRSYSTISPGDAVMRFQGSLQDDPVVEVGDRGQMEGMIVDLQSDRTMTLVAQRNVVYLDRGREDGLRVGDLLEVFRIGGSLPRRTVGEVKILALEERTATAMVSTSSSRILKGDRVTLNQQASGMVEPEGAPRSEGLMERLGNRSEHLSPLSQSAGPSHEGVRVQQAAGRTFINLDELVDQLEYESGEVTIKPEGMKVLQQIAEYLKSTPEKHIRVEGHADNVEIGPSLKSRYATNWDLSKARAASIVRYLVEQGGLDSAKLSIAGFGDTKPVSSNLTEDGRKKNRRIEIALYSTEPADPEGERATFKQPASGTGAGFLSLDQSSARSSFSKVSESPVVADPAAAVNQTPPTGIGDAPVSDIVPDLPVASSSSDQPSAPQP